jgi:mRNA-capping enzyme
MLKWKPASMNSVDFRLQISLNEGKGYLYVNGQMEPFSTIELSNDINHLNNRIIECRWWENKWDFMRERTDKSTPNHIKTVWAVIESINRPVTEEFLIQFIQSIKLSLL